MREQQDEFRMRGEMRDGDGMRDGMRHGWN